MMESIFSFLSSYFSLIFLAKGKNSKSISLFLSHIGPKRSCQSDCRIFTWNISLEQSGNSLFFACWYQKLRPDRKILGWTFFSIKVFFHRHWQVAGQMGKGREHLLFHPTTSTCSRTLRHLFATLYMRWLSCIFNCNTCVYQTATQWDLPPYQITIWLIDWWCNACLFTWRIDSRFFCYSNLTWETGGFDFASTMTLVLQAKQLTNCASHPLGWMWSKIDVATLATGLLNSLYLLKESME